MVVKKKMDKEAKQQRLLEKESFRESKELETFERLKKDVSETMEGYQSLNFARRLKIYQKYCSKKVFNAEYCPKCQKLNCHYSGRKN